MRHKTRNRKRINKEINEQKIMNEIINMVNTDIAIKEISGSLLPSRTLRGERQQRRLPCSRTRSVGHGDELDTVGRCESQVPQHPCSPAKAAHSLLADQAIAETRAQ